MSRKIALICALIGAIALLAMPAYAEVQNIRVSGDITAMGVYRTDYDLEDNRIFSDQGGATWYKPEDTDSFFMSIVRLRVDADLTDNVSACVRLANARDWDEVAAAPGNDDDITLDLAYITLKEMLYSPLTLIIGRQELMYGNGLIVGYGLFHDSNAVEYNDLLPFHGYDAVRAILDYDPWTLDLILAKMEEQDDDTQIANTTTGHTAAAGGRDSDTDLYGVNLGHTFGQYDAEMEGYLFYKRDADYDLTILNLPTSPSNGRSFEFTEIYTAGLRGSVVPLENLTLAAEIAGQWGNIDDEQASSAGSSGGTSAEALAPLNRDRQAMAVNVAGEYDFADVRFNPTVGLEYLYLSGEEAANEGDFEAWHSIYRGKFLGTIRPCLELLYPTNDPADTSGLTNQHTVKINGSLDLDELVDGLNLDLAYLHYWFDEEPLADADDDIGDEVTLELTYDYTEDVQFVLNSAWFIPGDYYDDVHANTTMHGGTVSYPGDQSSNADRVSNDTAVSIVGSCKVTF